MVPTRYLMISLAADVVNERVVGPRTINGKPVMHFASGVNGRKAVFDGRIGDPEGTLWDLRTTSRRGTQSPN
jgi:hypothetical protein